ncbi:hypothetical protein PNOK_0231000 [Pyrrhoderma noxium]|uniref:Rrp15p-domain-containing protein n=1 Tax=Pyrrhoderma noxium TaxID=2282107 RepID=A0A286URX1_9AGAM|nr:hypothetical protein PNOK_0231000 [Pyrrhoderma noxium]
MSLAKRRKVSDNSTNVDQDTGSVASRSDDEERGYEDIDSEGPSSQNEEADSSGDESPDTDEEIANAQRQMKSKKTQKRKRRATSPSHFGAALESLLNTNAPSAAPLALKPSVTKRRADEALEIKAKKLLEGEKKEKEEKNHVADVIGGWGGESERSLRKVAQRGVVKLFNAIQQTQAAAAAEAEETKAQRGSGKPTLPAPKFEGKGKKKKAGPPPSTKAESTLNQDAFLQMIRSGGIVSRS